MTESPPHQRATMPRGVSWNTHWLLTRYALPTEWAPWLEDPVEVVPVEVFLESARRELSRLLPEYWELLGRKTGVNPAIAASPPAIRTSRDLMEGLRLNPRICLPYVRNLQPEEVDDGAPHDFSRAGPPGGLYVDVRIGEPLRIREVLATASDEPDWGMDQDLFGVAAYGYGAAPFGLLAGPSSQAPFHMAFFHESRWLTAMLPGLLTNFMEERIRIFLSLSKAAFRRGVPYWGWRFGAWATHYLQDLTQPYHAKAYPARPRAVLRRLAFGPDRRSVIALKRNLLFLRHHLLEAAVHLTLNTAAKKRTNAPFLRSLVGEGGWVVGTVPSVLAEVSRSAVAAAADVDRSLDRLYDALAAEVLPGSADVSDLVRLAQTMVLFFRDRPALFDPVIDRVGRCFVWTGKVTRFMVREVAIAAGRTVGKRPSRRLYK